MKFILGGFMLLSSLSFAGGSARADDCFSDGYQFGAMEADSFCQIWEQMYNDDAVVYPRRMTQELCNSQLVYACKQGMAERARNDYPLCTWLVRNGWTNSQGQSATVAWAAWQRGSCNFVTP